MSLYHSEVSQTPLTKTHDVKILYVDFTVIFSDRTIKQTLNRRSTRSFI